MSPTPNSHSIIESTWTTIGSQLCQPALATVTAARFRQRRCWIVTLRFRQEPGQ